VVGNLVWKADFSQNNFLKKILFTSELSFGYIYVYIQWNSDNTTTHWTALNWPC